MSHIIKFRGYVVDTTEKYFVVQMEDPQKVKNVISTYGNLDFVPLITAYRCKVKYGYLINRSRKMGYNVQDSAWVFDTMSDFTVRIRKNDFDGSTSLTFILTNAQFAE